MLNRKETAVPSFYSSSSLIYSKYQVIYLSRRIFLHLIRCCSRSINLRFALCFIIIPKMFDTLLDRFHNVQQDISARTRRVEHNVKLGAGGSLLHRYQQYWMQIHQASEDNAHKAEEADHHISFLFQMVDHQLDQMVQLNTQLTTLPQLIQQVETLTSKIGELENQFEELEFALISLENMCEVQNLQEKQLDQRFKLALFKEKKKADLEQLKANLALGHVQKVHEFESKQQAVLEERQQAFKEVFEEEMEHYKTHGRIQKRTSSESGSVTLSLEEVTLEDDPQVLEEFLGSEGKNRESSEDSPGEEVAETPPQTAQ